MEHSTIDINLRQQVQCASTIAENGQGVHQTQPGVVREILKGPNVEFVVALTGLDAAMQIAKNMGPTPKQRAERVARQKERREKEDLKKDRDEELAEKELRRERQVTENIIIAEMADEGVVEIV